MTRRHRVLHCNRLENRLAPAAGGGFLNGGAVGEYFANGALAGDPAFVRRDVRIDFDWGSDRAPGGSFSRGLSAVGSDNYWVRWTGTISSRFSETYTFTTTSDDGVRLFIRPEGSANWTTMIDHWATHSVAVDQADFAMTANARYELRLEYREDTGPAVARLWWSSPSTPAEPVESATMGSINVVVGGGGSNLGDEMYADAVKSGRDEWGNATNYFLNLVPQDEQGWPLNDATLVVWEGRDAASRAGTYLLRFTGRAEVRTQNPALGQFRVGATNYGGILPVGAGYEAATNTTTAEVVIPATEILYLTFRTSQRTLVSPVNSGVADVQFMRPTSPGATTYHQTDDTFTHAIGSALARFTTLRFLTANFNTEVDWSDRVLPSYIIGDFGDRAGVWEYEVLFANELGKDLYVTIPMGATADYVTRLAQLVRFGSDGVNPYVAPNANPIWPGLNPNLRVYVEWSNEIWNWAFSQAGQGAEAARVAVETNTPEGQIINFDGGAPTGDFRRWSALKTVQASDTFRAVWGDAAMGDRVRILLEYQYDNQQDTAMTAFRFLDNYFNNGDGVQHVATPHPVSHYIWGAGGALYFGSENPLGRQSAFGFANAGFETPGVAPATAQSNPAGSSWTFTGNAGVFSNTARTAAATSETPGTLRNDFTGAAGYRFTVGANPITVYELGRWVRAGNNRTHTVRVVRANDLATVVQLEIATQGAASGQYAYARLAAPVMLAASTSYYLVSEEQAGLDTFGDDDGAITVRPELSVDGAVTANYSSQATAWNSQTWTFNPGANGGFTFGPVDMRFTTGAVGDLGFVPDAPEGQQAAFIGGTGSIGQTITFPTAGVFALEFTSAAKDQNVNRLNFALNGQNITPGVYALAESPYPVSSSWMPGARWAYDYHSYRIYGSAPFTISTPGSYTITITGTGTASQYTFLDGMRIASVDALFAGGLPALGQANGQVSGQQIYTGMLNAQASYAQAFGLHVVAYEGGWSVGGDFDAVPLQSWAKYLDARAAAANIASYNRFAEAGGAIYTFGAYDMWPTGWTYNHALYPLVQGLDNRLNELSAMPANGSAAPAILRQTDAEVRYNAANGTLTNQGWLSINVLIPSAGLWTIATTTTSGGQARVRIDDTVAVASGVSGGTLSGSVFLNPGLHSIIVKATAGGFNLSQITVANANAPAAPTLLTANDGAGSMSLAWTPVAGAAGYRVRYGTASGQYDFNLNAGNVSTMVVPGLTNGITYYVTVSAYNAAGLGLPSNERTVLPLGSGQLGALATWELTGYVNNEPSADVTTATTRVVVGPLTRGPGLQPGIDWVLNLYPNRFAAVPAASQNNQYGVSFAEALIRQQYFQFTIAPQGDRLMNLVDLTYQAAFQNEPAGAATGITFSTDGVNFTQVNAAGSPTIFGSPWTVNLASQAALQNVAGPVTVRIYYWGNGPFQAVAIGQWNSNPDLVVTGSVRERPAVQSVNVGDGSAQRSTVRSLTVTFNGVVTLDPGAFVIQRTGGGTVMPLVATTIVDGRTVATLTFTGAGTEHGSLIDGEYALIVNAAAVHDAAVPGWTMAADSVTPFHRLFGDADGDRDADANDFGAFRVSFDSSAVTFDFDNDGDVDTADFGQFRVRFGTSI